MTELLQPVATVAGVLAASVAGPFGDCLVCVADESDVGGLTLAGGGVCVTLHIPPDALRAIAANLLAAADHISGCHKKL